MNVKMVQRQASTAMPCEVQGSWPVAQSQPATVPQFMGKVPTSRPCLHMLICGAHCLVPPAATHALAICLRHDALPLNRSSVRGAGRMPGAITPAAAAGLACS